MATNVINLNANAVEPVFPIVKTESGTFTHQIPEDFHSGYIKGNTEGSQRLRDGLNYVASELTNLNVGRVRVDPNHKNNVEAGFRTIGKTIDETRAVLKAEQAALTNGLIQKSGFKANDAMTAFVVGTFQQMSEHEKPAAIAQLVEEGDGKTLAILASESTIYTKLSQELKDGIRNRLFAKADPQAFARLQENEFNLSRVERASIAAVNAYSKFSVPLHKPAASAQEKHQSNIG